MNSLRTVDKEIEMYLFMPENKAKIDAYMRWLAYFGGFSGQGTTALDIKPDVDMPYDLPSLVRMELVIMMMDTCTERANIFRQTVLEQLGEDFGTPSTSKKLIDEFERALKDTKDVEDIKKVILKEADAITSRMETINSSIWLQFKTLITGEFRKLHKNAGLLFKEFDRLNEQQTGIKK